MTPNLLAFVPWDPWIIGVLATAISVIVLCGSVYLLLATNTGSRLGFLIAFAGLSSWMFLLGGVWWLYGIGLIGDQPSWHAKEVLTGEQLTFAEIEDARVLPTDPFGVTVDAPDDWELLDPADGDRGEAQAVADELLVEDPVVEAIFAEQGVTDVTNADWIPVRAFRRGGENWPSIFGYDGKPLGFWHRENQLVVQVQPAQPAPPPDVNAVPPPRVADASAPVISVVLVRDLGNLRFPPFLVTLASGIAFAVSVVMLHNRDKRLWAAQDAGTVAS